LITALPGMWLILQDFGFFANVMLHDIHIASVPISNSTIIAFSFALAAALSVVAAGQFQRAAKL
ncbi:MAG: hypothetical protein KDA87_27440, partial [Planctomycetales bacterium]|nr:hypothetical protein [Planctomycetales bacterium]